MQYFFWGFLLVFLDFDIALPYGGTLNLLPAFLGCALLLRGTKLFGHKNAHLRRFKLATPIVFILGIADFVLDLSAPSLPQAAEIVISISVSLVSLYIAYEFAEGAKALERTLYKKLDADKLSAAWFILCMASLLMFLTFYFSDLLLPCLIFKLLAIGWFQSATFHFERKLSHKE